MTCSVCKKYEDTGTFVTGCDNFKVQTIKRHDLSEAHKKFLTRSEAEQKIPGTSVSEQTLNSLNKAAVSKLNLMFRNAHYIAKSGKPYTDYVKLCELDRAKGIDIGSTYQNDKYCVKFIRAIAAVRKMEQDEILNAVPFFSIISDGSTDTASKEAEIILLRSSYECNVYTHFMGIKNVTKADSTHILAAINQVLTSRFGESWKTKVIAMGTDGASVMLGKKSGVVQKMRELTKRPNIHAIHCSAHRLELAYKDAVKSLSTTTHQKCDALLLNLYLFYKYSPLNRANLIASYKTLGISSKVPTRVGGTRWLPHTRLAIQNVLHGYDAIIQHLEQIQNPNDAAHRKDSAAKGRNFLKLLNDDKIKVWLHFLLDVVTCLGMTSEAIQQQGACLSDIYNELLSAKLTLDKYRTSDGPNLKKLNEMGDVTLGKSRVCFLSTLVTAMETRFQGDLHLFKGSSFLEFKNWPSDIADQIDFGDCHIAEIMPSCEEALMAANVDTGAIEPEWMRLKTELYNSSQKIKFLSWSALWKPMHLKYPNLFSFIQYLQTLPSSSVDAERGFSRMKMIKNDWRSRLSDHHLSDLMLINAETPNVPDFDPEPSVNLWNASSVRSRRPFYMDEKKETGNDEQADGDVHIPEDEEPGDSNIEELFLMAETFDNTPSEDDDIVDDNKDEADMRDLIQLQQKAYKHLLHLM